MESVLVERIITDETSDYEVGLHNELTSMFRSQLDFLQNKYETELKRIRSEKDTEIAELKAKVLAAETKAGKN
jgi:hypothetical protein